MTILSKSIVSLINAEIVRENEAAQIYKAAALWCDANGYDGSRDYFSKQAPDEISHRDKFAQYLVDLDAQPIMPAVDSPTASYASLQAVFQAALDLETQVTQAIEGIYSAAHTTGDFVTCNFLQWFLDEQRQSLTELLNILRWFTAYGDDLAMIDDKIGDLAG